MSCVSGVIFNLMLRFLDSLHRRAMPFLSPCMDTAETVESSQVTSHHMATDLSHYMTAETVESHHMATDLSHHGGNCRVESQSHRASDLSHHGGNCRVESSHITW